MSIHSIDRIGDEAYSLRRDSWGESQVSTVAREGSTALQRDSWGDPSEVRSGRIESGMVLRLSIARQLGMLFEGLMDGQFDALEWDALAEQAVLREELVELASAYLWLAESPEVQELPSELSSLFYLQSARFWWRHFEDGPSAVTLAHRALDLEPDCEGIYDLLEDVALSLSDYAIVGEAHRRAALRAAHPESQREHLFRSARAFDRASGGPAQAVAIYEEMVRRDPTNKGLLGALEVRYEQAGRWDDLALFLDWQIGSVYAEDSMMARRIRSRLVDLWMNQLANFEKAWEQVVYLLDADPWHSVALSAARALSLLPAWNDRVRHYVARRGLSAARLQSEVLS